MHEGKRARKGLADAIAEYILEDENKEEVVAELRRYKREFWSVPDYNWYRMATSCLITHRFVIFMRITALRLMKTIV